LGTSRSTSMQNHHNLLCITLLTFPWYDQLSLFFWLIWLFF
jgi:hypothetical protein